MTLGFIFNYVVFLWFFWEGVLYWLMDWLALNANSWSNSWTNHRLISSTKRSVFSGVRVTRSLVVYAYFVDRWLSFCTFSFGHCVVCPSSKYGFWLPLWYLQTLLETRHILLLDSKQFYVIKFVSDLRQVGVFSRVLWFPPPIKLTATI